MHFIHNVTVFFFNNFYSIKILSTHQPSYNFLQKIEFFLASNILSLDQKFI